MDRYYSVFLVFYDDRFFFLGLSWPQKISWEVFSLPVYYEGCCFLCLAEFTNETLYLRDILFVCVGNEQKISAKKKKTKNKKDIRRHKCKF